MREVCSPFGGRENLSPAVTLLRERQRTNAFASNAENRIANRWQYRWERRFSEASRWIVGDQKMNVDFRRHLIHAHRRILVEIALHGAAALDGDFVAHQMAEPFDHRAAHFIQRAGGIDDLA